MKKIILVLIVGLCVVGGCAQTETPVDEQEEIFFIQTKTQTELIEEELADWKPDTEQLDHLVANLIDPKVDVVGKWHNFGGLQSSHFSIRRINKSEYSINFFTGGCLNRWTLKRTGKIIDGKLILNKPVQEYSPQTYNTLYLLKYGDIECLLSKATLRFLYTNYSKKDKIDWEKHLKNHAFIQRDFKGDFKKFIEWWEKKGPKSGKE